MRRCALGELGTGNELVQLALVEPADSVVSADEEYFDLVAEAFARVIDAKSPWTYQHSNGVAKIAAALSANLGFDAGAIREIRVQRSCTIWASSPCRISSSTSRAA